jgi:hypothetical protein
MTAIPLGERRFEIGRVVERTFSVLGRNFVAFYLLALALGAVPNALVNWMARGVMAGGLGPSRLLMIGLAGLVGGVCGLLVQGALVWGTVADLNGRKANFGELLQQGLSRALPILGVSIVLALGVALGFVFLVVPGLILVTMWAVVVPVTVVERPAFLGAFSRSAALTRGSRWAIFGLLVIVVIISSIIGGVAGAIGAVALSATSPLFYLVLAVVNALSVLVGAVGGAALYVELRAVKEGVEPETLARVFD